MYLFFFIIGCYILPIVVYNTEKIYKLNMGEIYEIKKDYYNITRFINHHSRKYRHDMVLTAFTKL